MSEPIAVMKIELCDPPNVSENRHWYYGLRIIEFDTDSPDKERITNIVERAYWHRTTLIEAIEDLLSFTQRAQREEEQAILEEMGLC